MDKSKLDRSSSLGTINEFWAGIIPAAKKDPAGTVAGLAALLGVGFSLADLFTDFELPSNVSDEVFLFTMSTVLFTVYFTTRRQQNHDAKTLQFDSRHTLLIDQVEQLVSEAELRQVASAEISALLTEELKSTSGWWFRGGSGRWFRNHVLPALAQRQETQPVYVQILDPRDRHLCKSYASYRSKQRDPADRRDNESDPRAIQTDLLACILATAVYSAHSRIRPEIVLLRNYSPLRIDMGVSMLLATVASRTAPGLLARSDSFFFKSVKDEFENASYGHGVVSVPVDAHKIPKSASMTADFARRILEECTIDSAQGLKSPLLAEFAAAEDLDFENINRKAFCAAD